MILKIFFNSKKLKKKSQIKLAKLKKIPPIISRKKINPSNIRNIFQLKIYIMISVKII